MKMRENPKAFFSFARSRQSTRARVGPFLDPSSNTPNSSPDFSSAVLKEQYDSVFAQPRPEWQVRDMADHFRVVDSDEDHGALTDIVFTTADIESACSKLFTKSAAEPDGIPAELINMSFPLYHL